MKYKTITIINDCLDANAVGRQQTRVSAILELSNNFIGVKNDLEAAGNIIDTLDAIGENKGLILVNVAPRNGKAKKWKNGTPFGWFKYKNTIIISTIDGLTLSLVKKFGLTKHINVFDFEKSLTRLLEKSIITKSQYKNISKTQFRSFDFTPRVAKLNLEKNKDICYKLPISEVEDAPNAIWWIDNFGNCKTTLLKSDLNEKQLKKYYSRLKDVPNNKFAYVTGSSGLGEKRFIELVVQGESAAKKYKLKVGDSLY